MTSARASAEPATAREHDWSLSVGWNPLDERLVPSAPHPTAAEIARFYPRRGKPVVFRGLAASSPSARTWTYEALRERCGGLRVPVMRVEPGGLLGYDASGGMRYETRSIAEVIDALAEPEPRYMLNLVPEEHFGDLARDLPRLPHLADAAWRSSRVTIAGRGNVTPFHREIAHNLFTMIRGSKEWVLAPPGESRNLYALGALSGVPHISPVDPRERGSARHPRVARCELWRVRLHPGDVLFVPRRWWHAVVTTEPAIGMGSWWADGLESLVSRAAGVYKRVRGLRT